MARRNISRMRFLIDVEQAGTTYHTIDLWQSLSIQERKLFRQLQTCHVVGGLVHDSNQDAFVRFATAPDTWTTRASIRRAFKLWKKQRSMALSEAQAGITAGKYSDFKVFLNNAHGPGTLKPYDSQDSQLPAGEWDYTTLVSEDKDWSDPALLADGNMPSDKFELQIVGDAHVAGTGANQDKWSRISLIKSWLDSRAEPDTDQPIVPAALSTDPLANLFDEVDANDDILDEINSEGDRPPYDEDVINGAHAGAGSSRNLQRMALAHTSGSNPTVRFAGFSAICGLVQVKLTASSAGTVEILMDVLHDGDKI